MLIECVLLSASLCHAVKDKPVIALTAMNAISATADGFTTKRFERRGYYEVRSPWLLGREPTIPRMVAVWSAQSIIELWASEHMRRNHTWIRHLWWVPEMLTISFHTVDAIRNSRLN